MSLSNLPHAVPISCGGKLERDLRPDVSYALMDVSVVCAEQRAPAD